MHPWFCRRQQLTPRQRMAQRESARPCQHLGCRRLGRPHPVAHWPAHQACETHAFAGPHAGRRENLADPVGRLLKQRPSPAAASLPWALLAVLRPAVQHCARAALHGPAAACQSAGAHCRSSAQPATAGVHKPPAQPKRRCSCTSKPHCGRPGIPATTSQERNVWCAAQPQNAARCKVMCSAPLAACRGAPLLASLMYIA